MHVWVLSRVVREAVPVCEGDIGDIRDRLTQLYQQHAWLLLLIRNASQSSWHSAQDDEEFEAALAAAGGGAHVLSWDTGALWRIKPDLSFHA